MERKEIVLTGKISMKEERNGDMIPIIELWDGEHRELSNLFMGNCIMHSVETLARIYQKDMEYNRPKGQYHYYIQWEGNKNKTQLFLKTIQQNYGEPNDYIDETDKI